MVCRCLMALGMCFLLQSCQPPTYDILAIVRGTDLVFEVRGSGSWPFRTDEDIDAHWVSVRDATRMLWAIESDPERPGCRPQGATPPLPLVYGRLPACYRERIASQTLRDGALNRIDGEGFRHGAGLFTLDRVARNVNWQEAEAEQRSWPNLPDPRFPRDAAQNAAGAASQEPDEAAPTEAPRPN